MVKPITKKNKYVGKKGEKISKKDVMRKKNAAALKKYGDTIKSPNKKTQKISKGGSATKKQMKTLRVKSAGTGK